MNYFISVEDQSEALLPNSNQEEMINYDPQASILSSSIFREEEFEKNLKDKFQSLKEDWLRDTRFDSNVDNLVNHPAYLKIISYKDKIIPILMDDMLENGNPWFYALIDITGENPIQKESRGNIELIINDWRAWYREANPSY